ncbi:hypothetical protein [Caulobacter endophyticus]|uniref:Uncharacterized protein n=1 Tax=Caulobacter endophyticus TaxID=2172652 RepID=A0A2T9JUC3_9CAUL|nr:hypothetical protein [Caulobacter endophyticus]PVM87325.1 hypothetical protein DDF67_13720 [Caulobacter endophyticus]
MSQEAKVLRRIDSADGKRYAELMARGGFYIFEEYTEGRDGEYVFMAPSHCSGLYATQAEAERDMIAQLPWLRDGNVV